jgi:hypothetical protein
VPWITHVLESLHDHGVLGCPECNKAAPSVPAEPQAADVVNPWESPRPLGGCARASLLSVALMLIPCFCANPVQFTDEAACRVMVHLPANCPALAYHATAAATFLAWRAPSTRRQLICDAVMASDCKWAPGVEFVVEMIKSRETAWRHRIHLLGLLDVFLGMPCMPAAGAGPTAAPQTEDEELGLTPDVFVRRADPWGLLPLLQAIAYHSAIKEATYLASTLVCASPGHWEQLWSRGNLATHGSDAAPGADAGSDLKRLLGHKIHDELLQAADAFDQHRVLRCISECSRHSARALKRFVDVGLVKTLATLLGQAQGEVKVMEDAAILLMAVFRAFPDQAKAVAPDTAIYKQLVELRDGLTGEHGVRRRLLAEVVDHIDGAIRG